MPDHRDCEHVGKPYAVGCFDCLDSMWMTADDVRRERDALRKALNDAKKALTLPCAKCGRTTK